MLITLSIFLIVLNFSLLTRISHRIPTVLIKEIIEDAKTLTLMYNYNDINNKTKVFLNGIILGIAEDPVQFIDEINIYRKSHCRRREWFLCIDFFRECV